jgi:hypothetical protein
MEKTRDTLIEILNQHKALSNLADDLANEGKFLSSDLVDDYKMSIESQILKTFNLEMDSYGQIS